MGASPYPRYSKEEFARRGNAIFEREVKPRLSAQDDGKFVAIDIETGEFECDPDEIAASRRLLARHPEAQIWFRLIGSPYTRRFGGRVSLMAGMTSRGWESLSCCRNDFPPLGETSLRPE